MPNSIQALAIFIVFALPGSLYIWSVERVVGPWGAGVSDRVFRFFGVSALIWVLYLPLGYTIWRHHAASATDGHPLRWLLSNVRHGGGLPKWLYALPIAYVALPVIVGTIAGRCVRSKRGWAKWLGTTLAGRYPAPRAWDDIFIDRPYGLVRARFHDGSWIGGLFAKNSYAAGFPQAPDIFLEEAYQIDSDGTFEHDADDYPVPKGSGILFRLEDVQFIETFF